VAFHSTQGPQLGLPQMIQSRPQFGYVGALLFWVVALIAYIGFNSFNQILAAQTVHALYASRAARPCWCSRSCRSRSRWWAMTDPSRAALQRERYFTLTERERQIMRLVVIGRANDLVRK
jgi:hypothetical protein